jgi:hypothetical protein
VRGALDRRARDAAHDHIERCDACRALVGAFDGLHELLVRSVAPTFPGTGPNKISAMAPLGTAISVTAHPVGVADDVGDGGADSGGGDTGRPSTAVVRWTPRARRLTPAMGGAAAVTVLVAGLAVFGTAVARDDPTPDTDTAVTDDRAPADGGGAESLDTGVGEASLAGPRIGRQAGAPAASGDDDDRGSAPSQEPTPTAAPEPTTSDRPSRSVTSDPPTTAPPRPAPEPDPEQSLVSWRVGWEARGAGRGTLTVAVDGPAARAPSSAQVVVTIALSDGAQVASGLDDRCRTGAGGDVVCTVAPPAPGDHATLAIDLTVDGGGQSAAVSVRQGGSQLGAQTVSLVTPAADDEPTTTSAASPAEAG